MLTDVEEGGAAAPPGGEASAEDEDERDRRESCRKSSIEEMPRFDNTTNKLIHAESRSRSRGCLVDFDSPRSASSSANSSPLLVNPRLDPSTLSPSLRARSVEGFESAAQLEPIDASDGGGDDDKRPVTPEDPRKRPLKRTTTPGREADSGHGFRGFDGPAARAAADLAAEDVAVNPSREQKRMSQVNPQYKYRAEPAGKYAPPRPPPKFPRARASRRATAVARAGTAGSTAATSRPRARRPRT